MPRNALDVGSSPTHAILADMAERFIAAVLKTVDARASQGSNPCVRASLNGSAR